MYLFTILMILVIPSVGLYFKHHDYQKSAYYKLTNDNMLRVMLNKGKYGEYLTSRIIEKSALKSHKQLVNVYLPKKNSNELTELDLIYLDRTGVYIIESKNYSGWIFGNEADQKWTQTMPNKKKFKFYNPIRQNATHIRAIQKYLEVPIEVIHSVIVFSERCQLKSIKVTSENVHVLKRDSLKKFIQIHNKSEQFFTNGEIQTIYNKLLPHTQVSEEVKKLHIQSIQQKYGK